MKIEGDYSLRSLNTFGLDVKARWYAEANSVKELQEALSMPDFRQKPRLILGGGSNILFRGDFEGLVIRNRIAFAETVSENADHAIVRAGAGMNWHEFVMHTLDKNLGGLENLSLIPGCVGAAPIQNIGAYGVEIKNTFLELEAVAIADGQTRKFSFEECRFGYRDSIFKHEAKNKYAIVSVSFRLNKHTVPNTSYGAIEDQLKAQDISQPTIRDVSNAVIAIRRSKLPDPKDIGNAGSFFKNPEIESQRFEKLKSEFPGIVGYPTSSGGVKLAAGWLIEQCGWKGKRVGNTGMHEKQALVLVNYGGATGAELITHAENVRDSVKKKFGVTLEAEVNMI